MRDDPLAHVAPGVPFLMLYEEQPDDVLWSRIEDLAAILAGMKHGDAGARIHRPDLAGWEHEVWVDCMHLDGPFLARLGRLTNDAGWQDLAAELLLGHARVLQDETNGLFSHGFNDSTGEPNRVHWGRGQGWALLGLVDTLHELPREHASAAQIQERLAALIVGLASTEIEPGVWSTVVDRPETYREASVSAFVALGVGRAIARGYVSAGYQTLVDRSWENVLANLSPEGDLLRVSDATPVGPDIAHYNARPLSSQAWGQGPALLAAVERSADSHIGRQE
jgi:rhamnogalacturonyl hydrolase YesR